MSFFGISRLVANVQKHTNTQTYTNNNIENNHPQQTPTRSTPLPLPLHSGRKRRRKKLTPASDMFAERQPLSRSPQMMRTQARCAFVYVAVCLCVCVCKRQIVRPHDTIYEIVFCHSDEQHWHGHALLLPKLNETEMRFTRCASIDAWVKIPTNAAQPRSKRTSESRKMPPDARATERIKFAIQFFRTQPLRRHRLIYISRSFLWAKQRSMFVYGGGCRLCTCASCILPTLLWPSPSSSSLIRRGRIEGAMKTTRTTRTLSTACDTRNGRQASSQASSTVEYTV